MSSHPTDFKGDVVQAIKHSIESGIEGAAAQVAGGGGHYSIDVVAAAFEGQSTLQRQRMVYKTISHLMAGDLAPVHAIDTLQTRTA